VWNISLKILKFTNDKLLIKKVINLLNISILDGNYFLTKKVLHCNFLYFNFQSDELIYEIMSEKRQLEKFQTYLNDNFVLIFNLLSEIELKNQNPTDDTLEFKPINLLGYENYIENPNHSQYFKRFFKHFIQEMKLKIDQSI
jgi:hypothetical protein